MSDAAQPASAPDKSAVQRAQEQLVCLRLKELKDVCATLRIRKLGGQLKQHIVERIASELRQANELANTDPNRLHTIVTTLEAAYARMIAEGGGGRGVLYMAPVPVYPNAAVPAQGGAAAVPPPPPLPIPLLGRSPQRQAQQQQQQQAAAAAQPSARQPHAPAGVGASSAGRAGSSSAAVPSRAAGTWQAGPSYPGAPAAAANGNSSARPQYAEAKANVQAALLRGYKAAGQDPAAGAAAAAPPGLGQGLPHGSPMGAAAAQQQLTVRCLCGQNVRRGEMVTCAGCKQQQHASCMALPALPPGQQERHNYTHWCEKCRLERADPYWHAIETLMLPAKLAPTGRSTMVGTKMEPVQSLDRQFSVSTAQYELFNKRRPQQYRLQVACLQLNDPCTFRMHWPTGCELRVNNLQYRVYARGPHAKMGANQRDEGANIGVMIQPGRTNRLTVHAADSSSYAVQVVLCKARSVEEVKALMKLPETLEAATARVRKQMSGAGDDSDDDVLVTQNRISLRCPLSGGRIRTPARFVDVPGMACFDLDCFLSMAEKSRKWQCPNSMRNSSVFNLQVDTYLATLLHALSMYPDVGEVEIDAQARWRPVLGGSNGAERPWHRPGEQPYSGPNAISIKAEPGTQAQGPAGPVGSDDESEEDEREELRKAVAAMKRGRPPSPEVISLLSSDEEDGPPVFKRPKLGNTHLANGAGPSGTMAAGTCRQPTGSGAMGGAGASAVHQQPAHSLGAAGLQGQGSASLPPTAWTVTTAAGGTSGAAAAHLPTGQQVHVPGLGPAGAAAHTAGAMAVPGVHFMPAHQLPPGAGALPHGGQQPAQQPQVVLRPQPHPQPHQAAGYPGHPGLALLSNAAGAVAQGNGGHGMGGASQGGARAASGGAGAAFFQPRHSGPSGRPAGRPPAPQKETIVIEISDSD